MRRSRVRSPFGIQAPQIPAQLTLANPATALSDAQQFSQLQLTDCDFSGQRASNVLFEQSHLVRVLFSQSVLALGQFVDLRCEVCDLAGATWEKAHISQVALLGCRTTGLKLMQATLEDVVFQQCSGDLGQFWETNFSQVAFDRCTLREASFAGANLAGVIFRGCDLTQVDLRGAGLKGTDFRGSILDGMQVGIKELQGAIFEPAQLIHLTSLLDITVKALEEPA